MKKETKLYRDTRKAKNILLFTGSIAILLAILFLYSTGLLDDELKIKPVVISGSLLLIMFFISLKILVKIIDKTPLIEIDTIGFSGSTTPLSKAFGRIEWSDVTNIKLKNVREDTLVVATLGNAEKFRNHISKIVWEMAHDEQNSELNLMYSVSEIDIDAQELYDLLLSYWKTQEKKN
ncbi:STM3941 family protein [Flavobacterium branchiarum]|uniref:STM3941 family protein n=1 Tax=Flavobacterium branchiarum TaxID=1114870 RepID=A0ABV5FK04_9FLAO|nr:STM3941 family protein [Flavobacterium branchiarum]MDN3672442.1 STM3941 family protein [Flavobacterium branchiarum]